MKVTTPTWSLYIPPGFLRQVPINNHLQMIKLQLHTRGGNGAEEGADRPSHYHDVKSILKSCLKTEII